MSENVAYFEKLALWSQVIGAVVFFAVIVAVFRKLLVPAIRRLQASRNAALAEAEARVDQARHDVTAARAELLAAESIAAGIIAEGEREAQREADHLLVEARHESERLAHNAAGELERTRLAAQSALRARLIERALARAREEITRRLDPRTDARLVSATIGDLVRQGDR